MDLNALSLPDLYTHLASTGLVRRLIDLARDEDLGAAGDITTAACIDPSRTARATLAPRAPGVAAGLATLPDLLAAFAPRTRFTPSLADGDALAPRSTLGHLDGPLPEILALERTLLNLISRLCGVATLTTTYLRAAGDSNAKLFDTRKTSPGLRVLEKYAVRCGGAHCHRIGLHDAVLIKDNHLAGTSPATLAAFIQAAAARSRPARPAFIEVEVDTLDQLRALLGLPLGTIDIVLLDNMGPAQLRQAVAMRDASRARVQLEASGGVNLATIAAIAATGVERISVGALTHGAMSLDIGLDILEVLR